MEIKNENELEEENPIKTAVGDSEQIDVYKNKVIIRGKGLANLLKIRGTFTPSQITSMVIKPAGTLYNGNIEIMASGVKYIVGFKRYQQADFEEVKILLAK